MLNLGIPGLFFSGGSPATRHRYIFYKDLANSFWQSQINPGGHSRNPSQCWTELWSWTQGCWNSHQYSNISPHTASCSPPLGGGLASLQSSRFSLLAELHPPSISSRCPQKPKERYKHHKALNPPRKPQPEMSHVCHWPQLSAKLFSCRNLLLANPLHLQSLYVCKILQKETSRAQSNIKTFGSATHLSLRVLSKCFEHLFKLCFFFHQIFTLILTVLKTLFLLAHFILQLFKLGRETEILKCT